VEGAGLLESRGKHGEGVLVHTPSSPSSAENTIMTECTQESGHFHSIYSLVCAVSLIVPVFSCSNQRVHQKDVGELLKLF
jgi:hypothetical protein